MTSRSEKVANALCKAAHGLAGVASPIASVSGKIAGKIADVACSTAGPLADVACSSAGPLADVACSSACPLGGVARKLADVACSSAGPLCLAGAALRHVASDVRGHIGTALLSVPPYTRGAESLRQHATDQLS